MERNFLREIQRVFEDNGYGTSITIAHSGYPDDMKWLDEYLRSNNIKVERVAYHAGARQPFRGFEATYTGSKQSLEAMMRDKFDYGDEEVEDAFDSYKQNKQF